MAARLGLAGAGDPAARLAVVGVPLSRTSILPSQAHTTPPAVRAALRRFASFHAGLGVDLPPVRDLGDLDVSSYDTEQALTIDLSFVQADLVVVLGGDNAVTRAGDADADGPAASRPADPGRPPRRPRRVCRLDQRHAGARPARGRAARRQRRTGRHR